MLFQFIYIKDMIEMEAITQNSIPEKQFRNKWNR